MDYFDRFANDDETGTISPTTWNEYSIGARQCKMQLDIVESNSAGAPSKIRFSYLRNGERKEIFKTKGGNWKAPNTTSGPNPSGGLPDDYVDVGDENSSKTFTTPHDLAYGLNGAFAFIDNFTGTITFNNATFGDPIVGTRKRGFARPTAFISSQNSAFDFKKLGSGQECVVVYPERISNFLNELGGDSVETNNSLVVNVDYSATGSASLLEPQMPFTDRDYGVILQECGDLSDFKKGFSLVTNLRLYIGDDFNVVPISPPSGYTPPSGTFYPPASLFAPEKRYGVDFDPFAVEVSGQIGSVASENDEDAVHPMDAIGVSENSMVASQITMNLSTISHPAELPPIVMMNWLILIEEKRAEFD